MQPTCQKNGVIFLLIGKGHAPLLAVSLHSLRRHYGGPVAILTDEPDGIARNFRGLDAEVVPIEVIRFNRNSAHVTKTASHRWSPYETTIFIDADTLILGDPSPLFDAPPPGGIALTRFADWWLLPPSGKPGGVYKRVRAFAEFAGCLDLFELRCREGWPTINTGVYAFRKGASVLEAHHELCRRGWKKFICDECSMQLEFPAHPHAVLGDEWNWSPLYGKAKNPVVCHMHGSKVHAPRIKAQWRQAFEDVWNGNVARIREWMPEAERRMWLNKTA